MARSFEDLACVGKELFSNTYTPDNTLFDRSSGMNSPISDSTTNSKGIWTPEQDEALRSAVAKHGAKHWKAIALEIPGERTHIQCLQRWSKVLKPGLVKGAWSEDEDAALRHIVQLVAKGNWVGVAEHIPGRTAKQCRERWMLVLDPSIRKDEWTKEEDELLIQLHQRHGNSWALIAKQLDGRTENSTKSRFKSLERKRERSWTAHEDSTILRARAEHASWEAIAEMLPNRTKHACKMRWKDLQQMASESSSSSPSPYCAPIAPAPAPRGQFIARAPPPPPRPFPPPAPPALNGNVVLDAYKLEEFPQELFATESFEKWLKEPKFELHTFPSNNNLAPPQRMTSTSSLNGGDVRMNSGTDLMRQFSSSRLDELTALLASSNSNLDMDFTNFEDFDRV